MMVCASVLGQFVLPLMLVLVLCRCACGSVATSGLREVKFRLITNPEIADVSIQKLSSPLIHILLHSANFTRRLFPRGDGSFSVRAPMGNYILELSHPQVLFNPMRVVVDTSKVYVRVGLMPGNSPMVPLGDAGFKIKPYGRLEFLETPQSFDMLGMVRSPSVLLILFLVGSTMLLPKLTSMIDPDTLQEAAALAGGSAGDGDSSNGERATSAGQPAAAASAGSVPAGSSSRK